MPTKLKLVIVLSALFLTMCRSYDQNARLSPVEGLSCEPYTDYFRQGLQVSKGLECYYTCPDETVVGPLDFETDPSLSFSEGDLDQRFCNIEPQFTASEPAPSVSPIPAASPTEAASPTPQDSPTPESSPTVETSLLTGLATMCDTGANLISFRMAEPVPDLTGRTVTVQIAGLDSTCSVNPTNPSLLTCTIPPDLIFPARVVVSLDGVMVNDFTYDGVGCQQLTTPVPTTTP